MNSIGYYDNFQEKALKIKLDFSEFLIQQKKEHKKVAAYGAAAKGNTLLNFCGIKNDLIKFVVDANPYKQNKYLPASHIPVVTEDQVRKYQPDFVIIFPWNIKEEVMNQMEYIKEWGGKFVVPIPGLQVI
jgi:FlaA1/EpsC-like NDP-sugar epimerase